ncbi:MAG: hypothetical protein DLM73_16825 [Chthoniobacterales bacterium]|nr:MAG: hypothetical protein DLM73_16825 [Chthoniobacterales bacterium]
MTGKKIIIAMLLSSWSAALATSAAAHDTWLLPDRFEVAPKTLVTLDLTSGMAFPALETGPKRERVETARCRLAGRIFEIEDISAGPKSLVFKAPLPEAGLATLWVKLPPKSIELKPAEVQEYLDEIDAPASLKKEWAEMKEPRRWRELYTKHPKTFVRVAGEAPADRSWTEPVGMALEIVPEKDPTMLREGDDFPVRILKNGAPFPSFSLNAVAAGETKGETRKTDSAGRMVLRFNKAGRWLLRGTDVRKSARSDADWESDFATLTLEVKQK